MSSNSTNPQRALRVTVWNENVHESTGDPAAMADYYPNGIHGAVAAAIGANLPDAVIRTAVLSDPEHGLTEAVLSDTDVLVWWGHIAHEQVSDEVVDRVHNHVLGGMGLIVLHSGHFSRIFKRLMGTTCSLQWRNKRERELVWNLNVRHPIAEGVISPIVIPEQEMYGEVFDIPTPDEIVFVSTFAGGEVFRSGITYFRGNGRIFYFSPGDQDYPVYNQPEIGRVISNGVVWAAQPDVPRSIPAGAPHSGPDWFLEGR